MKKNTLLVIAGCALATALVAVVTIFGVWRYVKYRHAPPPPQGALLRDRSDSNLGGCDDLAAMANEILGSSGFEKGSFIAVMVTGDDSTAGEPLLVDTLEVSVSRRVAEGRSHVMQQQLELLDKIKRRCQEAGQTNQSPIYMAIRRAVEYLRARGCDGRSTCILYVQSDLEELSERNIRELIDSTVPPISRASLRTQQLPTPINNSGISIKICGLSETVGATAIGNGRQRSLTARRDSQRADRIYSVWAKMFTDPQLVTFSPHCPRG